MLLSLSVNRLFSSQSRRRRNRRAATAQVELSEPRRCLSATATADPGIDEVIEDEFVGFDAVWFDDADYAYTDLSYDWYPNFDAEFDFSGDDESDWIVSDWTEYDGWYVYDTWTDAEWIDDGWFSLEDDAFKVDDSWYEFDVVTYDWSDDSFGFDTEWFWYEDYAWAADDEFWSFGDDALLPDEDLEYSFGNDALIPDEDLVLFDEFEIYDYEYFDAFADSHWLDEGIIFDVGDEFACELFFLDDVVVEDVLFVDDLSAGDASFDVDMLDADFGSGEVFVEQVVFEDEFVFVDFTTFEDDTFFEVEFDDVAVFEDDVFFESEFEVIGFEDEFFEVVFVEVSASEDDAFFEDVFADIVGFDDDAFLEDGFVDAVDQPGLEFFDSIETPDITVDSGLSDVGGTDAVSGDLKGDSKLLDAKVDVFDTFDVQAGPLESVDGTDDLAVFTTGNGAKADGGNDAFALNGSLDISTASPVGPGIGEADESGVREVGLNDRSRTGSKVDNPIRAETRRGSLAALARHQHDSDGVDRTQPNRRSVNNVLARQLHSHTQERRATAEGENTPSGKERSERTIPLMSHSPQWAQQVLTQQSPDAVTAQQRSARSRFDFRMSRAAAQASRLTTQPRSESQDVSYDATLLAFEHPSLSMQLDGLSMPTHNEGHEVSEIHEGQPGYAQMVSAAGTVALTGAAGVHFTQRRGWSMLLRFARALLGRI